MVASLVTERDHPRLGISWHSARARYRLLLILPASSTTTNIISLINKLTWRLNGEGLAFFERLNHIYGESTILVLSNEKAARFPDTVPRSLSLYSFYLMHVLCQERCILQSLRD